ncbi:MAG: hypothetical protein AAF530_24215 [Pseudomonadota bacterium]
MKSLFAAAALGAAFFMSACQSLTTEQRAFVSCQGYLAVIEDLHLFKDQLSTGQKDIVVQANKVVLPTCEAVADGQLTDYTDALQIVTQNLTTVFTVQEELGQ